MKVIKKCIYIIGIDDFGYLHIKNFKTILKNTFYFINIINKYQNIKYKICFFYINQYIFYYYIFIIHKYLIITLF